MSLYSQEEVCVACHWAKIHECCGKVCKCILGKMINYLDGECDSFRERKSNIDNKYTYKGGK